jgi:ethylene-insensitive protein 3
MYNKYRVPIRQQQPPVIKDEMISNFDFAKKRKPSNELNVMMDNQVYTCEFLQCPHSELCNGFNDRSSRDNHQLSCPFRTCPQFSVPKVHITPNPPPFIQSKPAIPSHPINPNPPPPFDLTGLGVPDDGQRLIDDLMSFYESNVQINKTAPDTINTTPVAKQPPPPPPPMCPRESYHLGRGVQMENNNIFQDNTNLAVNHSMFPLGDHYEGPNMHTNQFDQQCRVLNNTPFNTNNGGDDNFQFVYGGSQFNVSSMDFTIDGLSGTLPKQQDISIWYQ